MSQSRTFKSGPAHRIGHHDAHQTKLQPRLLALAKISLGGVALNGVGQVIDVAFDEREGFDKNG